MTGRGLRYARGLPTFFVRRRRLFVVGSRIDPSSWKLRTLLVDALSRLDAEKKAAALRRWPNEWQDVRRADREAVFQFSGHQTERRPAGVGML